MRPTLLSIFFFIVIALHSQTILPPGTTVYQNFKSGNFEDSLMIVRDYTHSGIAPCRLDAETYWTRSINNEIWMELKRFSRKYDGNDHMIEYEYAKYDHHRGIWKIESRDFYTYTNNLLVKKEWFTPDQYAGSDHSWINYTYDSQNRMIKSETITHYNHISFQHPNSKTLYFYDDQGRASVDSIFNWSGNYYPIRLITRHYDNENHVDSLFTINSGTIQNSLITYEYDAEGSISNFYNFIENNWWIPTTRNEYIFDEEHRRQLFTNNYRWNTEDDNWELYRRLINEEFCTDEIVAEPAPDDELLFRIYPNPGLQLHLLPLKDNRNINTITFTDIRGVVIFEDQFQWPHLEAVTRKSANIPPGFYFVTIASDKHQQDIKWIKVE